MLEKHRFCKYCYTSSLQTLAQREWLCLQCWGWRGICAGYSGRVLLWNSLHQTISVSTLSKKQRTVPLFSCLRNVTEATDKEEEGCLKTLENAKIRRKKDSEIVSLCHGGKPWSLIVLTLGEGDLHDQSSLELDWLSSGLLHCLKTQLIKGRSKIIRWSPVLCDFPTWGKCAGSCVVFKVVGFHDPFYSFVLFVRGAQSSHTATTGCLPAAWYLQSVVVSEFFNLPLKKLRFSSVSWPLYHNRIFTDLKEMIAFSAALGKYYRKQLRCLFDA